MDQPVKIVKPFVEYDELVRILTGRGMIIRDPLRAQRKLTQVGYYRLSGYWGASLKYVRVAPKKIEKLSEFQENTTFESIFEFYLFDKKLRLELTCALERIEIYLRTIIAHELGRIHPLAHLNKKNFSKFATNQALVDNNDIPSFDAWQERHNKLLRQSHEESILSHIKTEKPIPIWVASEAWDFGVLSKLYSMLNGTCQQLICDRIGIDKRQTLDNWLINLNGIRNRCAHHSRLCNRPNIRTLIPARNGYFNLLNLQEPELNKFYGLIAVIWYLVKQIGPGSSWINRIADIIDSKPNTNGLTFKSLGFEETGFPRKLFPQTLKANPAPANLNQLYDRSTQSISLIVEHLKRPDTTRIDLDSSAPFIDRLMDFASEIENLTK